MREQYATTDKSSMAVGVDEAMRPDPPPGQGWRLVSAVVVGGTRFIYWWRRPAPRRKRRPARE